jgi:hypothetical protein
MGVAVCALLVVMQGLAVAQLLPGLPSIGQPLGPPQELGSEGGTYCAPGFRTYFSSYTSYQFPNPFSHETNPLSRLEFPIDQWFVGVKTGYRARGWSAQAQGWVNVNKESRALMQDSDWDDETTPHQKTIFSESRCRLNKGLLFDLGVRMNIPLQFLMELGDIAGVGGWRYDYFYFTTHDGEQKYFGEDAQPLPGDGIDFTQSFYHTYVGVNMRGSLDPSRILSLLPFGLNEYLPTLPPANCELQVDYALVTAKNEDLHLLREGNRITTETTRGHCWHALFSLECLTLNDMRTLVQFDFKRLLTHGSHRLTNNLMYLDFSFDGSRVWSDLASITVTGELKF